MQDFVHQQYVRPLVMQSKHTKLHQTLNPSGDGWSGHLSCSECDLKLTYTPPKNGDFPMGILQFPGGPHFQGRTISFKGGYWSWSHDMMLDGQGGEVETNYRRWMVETDVFLFKSDIRSWVFSKWNLSFKAGKIGWDSFFFGTKQCKCIVILGDFLEILE